MNVRLGSFAKKKNSTAVPSGGLVTTITGALRDGCSVERPMIGFAADRMTSPVRYNYAFVVEFARYYYIQDWEWYKGLWWAHMEVDPMATYKTQIGAASCYVLRAAAEYDNRIVDALYPTKNEVKSVQTDLGITWINDFSSGTYVVGILGKGSSNGAVNYYAMSPATMASFRSALLSDVTDLVGTTEITSELTKVLFNPFQYVVSAMYFPFALDSSNLGASVPVKLGWWDTGVSANTILNMVEQSDDVITVYANPAGLGNRYEPWMLLEPYTEYTLFYPPWGLIKLDSRIVAENIDFEVVGGSVEIETIIDYDLINGMAYITIKIGGTTVAYKQTTIGVNTIMAQSTQDIIGGALDFIGGGSIVAGNFATGGLMGLMTGNDTVAGLGQMYNGVKAFMPEISVSGTNGGLGAVQPTAFFTVSRTQFPDVSVEENGRPLCKTKVISTLPGYVKTMNCDIAITGATDAEQEKVRAIMNGGFFYE